MVSVQHKGQAVVEFLVMIGFLTVIGTFLLILMNGRSRRGGAVDAMGSNAITAIARDTN